MSPSAAAPAITNTDTPGGRFVTEKRTRDWTSLEQELSRSGASASPHVVANTYQPECAVLGGRRADALRLPCHSRATTGRESRQIAVSPGDVKRALTCANMFPPAGHAALARVRKPMLYPL